LQSIVYRSNVLYELHMVLLYREHYTSRYDSIAKLIPPEASVLDVCCGPAVLYSRHLKGKCASYTGFEINDYFLAKARAKGIPMIRGDLTSISELPRADVVVMQASLYQFLPDKVSSVVQKLLRAANRKVIVAEPVRNVSSSRIGWLARFAQHQTDAGSGPCTRRFDEASLAALMSRWASIIERSFPIPGGREVAYLLRPEKQHSAAISTQSALF
jgi:SAM-dependent methyltransferase